MAADDPQWLVIARELRAIAQTGLTFTSDRFDRQRYDRLRELAASMLAQGAGAEYGAVVGLLKEDRGYGTPKVDVRGAAFVEGRVLLVREISDGKWTLPGGWADGHPPRNLDSIYKMFFLCDITGGAARASDETSEAAFFARDELPPLSLGRTTAAQIDRMFHHAEYPDIPADFD